MSTSAINGASYIVEVDGNIVGEDTSLSHDKSRDTLDATAKQDDHTKSLYGDQDDTLSLESLWVPTTGTRPGLDAIEQANDDKNFVTVGIQEDGTLIDSAQALVTEFNVEAENNSTAQVSIQFQLNETLSYA